MKFLLFFFVFLCSTHSFSQEEEDQYQEWILSIELITGEQLSETSLVYKIKGKWYISLDDFTNSISIKIENQENIHFYYWKNRKITITDISQYEFSDTPLIPFKNLSRDFQCKNKINLNLAKLILDCAVEYPAISKIKRENKKSINQNKKEIDLKDLAIDEQSGIQGPFIDLNLATNASAHTKSASSDIGINTAWSSQNSSLVTYHSFEPKHDSHRVTYYYNSNNIEDPYFTELQAVDTFSQEIPLVRNSIFGKGLSLTNYPKYKSNSYASKNITGPLQPGWQVELYRGNQYLGLQTSEEGFYSFRDIPIFYGQNNFTLKFFGPYGESRTEAINYNINRNISKNNILYRISTIESQKDSIDEKEKSNALELQIPISDSFIFQIYAEENPTTLEKYQGLRGQYLGSWSNLSIMYMDQLNAGDIIESELVLPMGQGSISLKNQKFNDYTSSFFDTVSHEMIDEINYLTSVYSFSTKIPFNIQVGLEQRQLQEKDNQNFQNIRFSTQLASHGLDLNIKKEINDNETETKEFNHQITSEKWRLREGLIFNEEKLTKFEINPIYKIEQKAQIRGGYQRDFLTNLNQYSIDWGKSFQKYALNMAFLSDGKKEHSIIARINLGLQRDHKENKFYSYPQGTTNKGAIRVVSFYDTNYNGKFDLNEKAAENLSFEINQQPSTKKTDVNGLVFMGNLPLYWPIELRINLESLEDPSFYPTKEKIHLICKRGSVTEINFPIAQLGDLDSFFSYTGERDIQEVTHYLKVNLTREDGKIISTHELDDGGYLYLTKLKFGKYKIVPDQTSLEKLNLKVVPLLKEFEINEDNTFISSLDFEIVTKDQ